jgi:hypothetical protein
MVGRVPSVAQEDGTVSTVQFLDFVFANEVDIVTNGRFIQFICDQSMVAKRFTVRKYDVCEPG